MRGKHTYSYKGKNIIFDFDNYRINYMDEMDENTCDEIHKDEEFCFLSECLTCKYSYFKGLYDADENKYNELCIKYNNRYYSSNL